jgi:hypothetical protein
MKLRGLVLVVLFTLAASGSSFADPIGCVKLGLFCFDPNAPGVGIVSPDGSGTQIGLGFSSDGKSFRGSGAGPDYFWQFSGNTDPLINWAFGAAAPGVYSVIFFMPVVGGPYDTLTHLASMSVSDVGGANSTTVNGISVLGQVPAGSTIAGATLLSAPVVAPPGGFGDVNMGPAIVNQAFGNPPSMAVWLGFGLVSPDNDGSASFNGRLELGRTPPPVPEPGSMLLLGTGLVGLCRAWRKRRQ